MNKTLSWTTHGELTPASPPPSEPSKPPALRRAAAPVPYAELHLHTDFSFLDGASEPEALVAEAARLGHEAIAVTDHDGLYAAVRLAQAAKDTGVRTVFGAELSLAADRFERTGHHDPPGEHLLILARDLEGYRALSCAIGDAHLAGPGKGRAVYDLENLADRAASRWAVLTGGCRKSTLAAALHKDGQDAAGRELERLRKLFGRDNVIVELVDHDMPGDDKRNDALSELAERYGAVTIATNNVHYATPSEFLTANALAALRARKSLDEIEGWLPPGPTAHLRSGEEMAARFARFPGILQRTVQLARECAFDFTAVTPSLPDYPVPGDHDESSWLRELVEQGARERYGTRRERPEVYQQLDYELGVIAKRGFAGYFLIVYMIAKFCRDANILAQGRGSAANSAVCYALHITNVDPIFHKLVFERFLSPEREGYPDIDLDIEAARREEVIQWVYKTYGREYAAQVANVITYRARLAIRDAARALGYSPGTQDAWAKQIGPYASATDLQAAGLPDDVLDLAERLHGRPRHLGIHSGGMVIADRPIAEVCPTEWARMADRSILTWDKDDCADAGLVKFDLLGLGMLGALHDAFDLVRDHHGVDITLGTVPPEDSAVYDMLCDADSVGLFQVESRAQASTLPRLKPRKFYDLVIEVALIRPGPIQGGAVHPYLRRRADKEPATAPHKLLEEPLKRTLGVPLFQEQVMQMACAAASFSPAAADELRRAMGAKRSTARMQALRQRLLAGMAANGIESELAEDIYRKLEAFSSYGFPESHSISFAYLVYASAYLKCFYPAAFTAALLRNQPMGFYAPATLVADAARHDVTVRGVDIHRSQAKASLEQAPDGYQRTHRHSSPHPQPALRLGLDAVRSLGSDAAERIVHERDENGPYRDLEDFVRRTYTSRAGLEALATAGAFDSLGLTRREALWQAGNVAGTTSAHLPGTSGAGSIPPLAAMTAIEQTFADLWATGTAPGSHPIAYLREQLKATGHTPVADLHTVPDNRLVRIAGLVICRQSPPTAGGVTFLSLEDETGICNVVCSREVWARERRTALAHGALRVTGHLERSDHGEGAINIVAGRLSPLRVPARPAGQRSRDFR